jgi:hypothetical protein
VRGLELVDEEELEAGGEDASPIAYLLVPDARALRELESLWNRWRRGDLQRGETPWREVFGLLRDLRPWGPQDRVRQEDREILADEIANAADDQLIRIELELVFRTGEGAATPRQGLVAGRVAAAGGRVVFQSRIDDIAYEGLLVDLPARAIQRIIELSSDSVAGLDAVMHIRAQSVASSIEVTDSAAREAAAVEPPVAEPILALLDGVPVAAHRELAAHVIVDDQFGLEPDTPVVDRVHGTAMASLIIHGDRNRSEGVLPRRIHLIPVLGAEDKFPPDRLIVDVIYRAIVAMRAGPEATAPTVLIVNLSLGNRRRRFHGQLSAWARLIDSLSYRFGLLFVVSAGNCPDDFTIGTFNTNTAFEDAPPELRATETLRALSRVVSERRLLSPAETVNGLTIGAYNHDSVADSDRLVARVNVDPYGELQMANPSSALGPGFALSVKPDFLMPGAREHVRMVRNQPLAVKPAAAGRAAGLRVAAPPRDGRENLVGFTNGTSAAAALASRTAHRIYDALEAVYANEFTQLPAVQRIVLLKALLVHPAKWPQPTATFIRETVGPDDGRQHVRQKDNIRRFMGYGIVDADDAVYCAGDRATFWATGSVEPNMQVEIMVPIPAAMSGQARTHSLSATLAWLTPIAVGRRSYRSVQLKIVEPEDLGWLAVSSDGDQPDSNQSNRGTVITRRWSGVRAPNVTENTWLSLIVQRAPDRAVVDGPAPFGLAVTIMMPGVDTLYVQVQQRLTIAPRTPA